MSQIKVWDTETERKRLLNLRFARESFRTWQRHEILTDYIPGHVWYNWAEYPAERCPTPTEEDEKNFSFYKEKGMGLIKIHEEWNDALEIFGLDKFKPNNENGFRAMIDLAHKYGMKFIPYISSGYFDRRSKYYDPKWQVKYRGNTLALEEGYFDYGLSSPRSPDWRAFLLNNIEKLFDSYPIDGLYDDVGYDPLAFLDTPDEDQGHIDAFEESSQVHGAFEDLVQEIYSIVRRYRGIFTLHAWEFCNPIISAPPRFKCWDYLYVGEGIKDTNQMRRTVRGLPPFVFYIPDWRVVPFEDQRKVYALSIPYLQFPVLYHGRPITGKMYTGDKLPYRAGSSAVAWPHLIAEHYRNHPDDPPVLSPWDSIPGNPRTIENYFRYFDIYKLMTKPGSHVFIDIRDQSLLISPVWPDLVLSAYVNDEFFLVAANFLSETNTLVFKDCWTDTETGKKSREWTLAPFKMRLLRR
jgi:hypothetical protein